VAETSSHITERKQAEAALLESESVLRSFFDSAGAMRGIVELEQADILHISDNAITAALFGETKQSMRNKRASELGVPPEIVRLWIAHYLKSQQTDEAVNFEYLHKFVNGERWLSATVSCLGLSLEKRPRFAYVIVDVTERKLAEEAIRELLDREQAARFEAEVVRDASFALTRNLSLEKVLETLLDHLRKLVPFESANVMLLEGDARFVVRALRGYKDFADASAAGHLSFDLSTHPSLQRLFVTRRSVLIADTNDDPAWRKYVGTEHVRNWLAVPLIVSGKVVGVYSMDKAEPGFFTAEHVRLAETLASQAASAIQNAQSFQQSQHYAVELEERIAERERVQQALRESESFRRTMIESEPDCVKVIGLDCTLLDVNPAGLAMIGADNREQVVGESVLALIAPEWRTNFIEMHERVCRGESMVCELEMIGLNGVRRRIETHAAPLRNPASDVVAHLAITRDVSERKRAEESLKIFRNLIDQSSDAIEVLDPSTLRFLDCNASAHQSLGYSREEFLSLGAFDIDPTIDQPKATRMVEEIGKSGFMIFESVHRRKDGSTFPVEINVKSIRLERDYHLAVVRDLTERKQGEERLKEYEKVVENLEEMIAVVDREYRYLLANRAFLAYRGMKREQVLGQLISTVLDQEIFEKTVKPRLDECFQGKIVRFELNWTYPEVGERVLFISYFPIEGPQGIDRVACVLADITEKKRAQESLRQSENQLTEAQQLAHVGSWNWDMETNDRTWSEELYRIFGQSLDTPASDLEAAFQKLVHPDDREFVRSSVERSISNKEACSFSYRIIRPDGAERFIHSRGNVVTDSSGKLIRMFGTAQDVTERKRTEQAISEAEQKYRDIYENASEGIFQSTPDGRFISANPALARIHGFDSPEEFMRSRTNISQEIYVDPKRREEFKRLLAESGMVRGFEHQVRRKDGSKIWITVNARAVRDRQRDEVLYYEGTAQDITERKRTEEALRESEERYRELFENAKDACYVHDLSGEYSSVNRAAEVLSGYTREEIIGKNFRDFIAPEQMQHVNEHLGRKLLEKGETTYETELVAKDGRRVPVEVSSHLLYENGVGVGVQGTARDITERKRAEDAIRQSERDYRGLFENAHDAILIIQPEHEIVLEVNQRACEIYGINRAEFIGMSLETISKNIERGRLRIKETLGCGTSYNYETIQRRGDGTEMFLDINASVVEYKGQTAIQSINRDITKQKRGEEALRQSEERFSKAFHSSPAALSIALLEDGRLLEVNAAFLRMTGFSREEVIGRSTLELGLWDRQHRLMMADSLRKRRPMRDIEIKFQKKSGEIRDGLLSVELIQLGTAGPSVLGIAQDITESKRIKEALQNYPRQLIEAQEAERQSIARELHDQIGQVLTAIQLNLQAVGETCETIEARALIDEGVVIVDEALCQVRGLSFELRPSVLDDLGLVAALRWYTDRFAQRTGIHATTAINLRQPPVRFSLELQTACFRIVQEALTNVVRHAKARNVEIELKGLNDEIRLSIKDDGIGFDMNSQDPAHFTTHVGLRGMRERALALGGRLGVKSSPARGTKICAHFPNHGQKSD
jgi:PAS domain S-box-containing protein